MPMEASVASVALGRVEDLEAGSSPARATMPPRAPAPTKLPWRSASAARSTPGALPYHQPTTPSTVAFGSRGAICEPHTEVAPSSSLSAG